MERGEELALGALEKRLGRVALVGVTKLQGGATKAGPSRLEILDATGTTRRFVYKPVRASEARVASVVGRPHGEYGAPETLAAEIDEAHPWEFTSWVLTPFIDGPQLTFSDRAPDQILNSLAKLHADHRERTAEFGWTWTFDGAHMRRTLAQAIDGVRKGRNRDSEQLANRLEPLLQLTLLETLAERLPRTLCHGDIHPGNIVTDPEGQSWLIDWGNVCVAPPTLDIANLIAFGSEGWRTYQASLRSAWQLDEATLTQAYYWAKVATGLQYLPWIAANTDSPSGMIDEVLSAAARLDSLG